MLRTFRLLDDTTRYVAFQESDIDKIIFYPMRDDVPYNMLYQVTLKNGKTYECVEVGPADGLFNKSLADQIANSIAQRIE